MSEFNVVTETFQNSKVAFLILLFRGRWAVEVTEAAPVCLSQELFSLFHLLLVSVPIPEVVVGTVLIVSRCLGLSPKNKGNKDNENEDNNKHNNNNENNNNNNNNNNNDNDKDNKDNFLIVSLKFK